MTVATNSSTAALLLLLICLSIDAVTSSSDNDEQPTIHRNSDGVHVTAPHNESIFVETNGGKFFVNGRDVVAEIDAWKAGIQHLLHGLWTGSELKLTAQDVVTSDRFGFSVAASGTRIVAGADRDGYAYVYTNSGGTWIEEARLQASDRRVSKTFFGTSVSVSGNTIVVGAHLDDDKFENSGAAYVFVHNGSTWTEQTKLTPLDAEDGDRFGYTVAVSGDTIVVGAYSNDDAGDDSGSAYVYVRNGDTWTEQTKLTATDEKADDYFGSTVAIDGDTIVIGAQRGNAAYVFVRNGNTWTEEAKLSGRDVSFDDFSDYFFGISVSISVDTIVVGAYTDDTNGETSGSAYVFVRSPGGVWSEQAKLTASDAFAYDRFGYSVSISEDTVVIGAYGDDDKFSQSGSCYVFKRHGNTWIELIKLIPRDATQKYRLGYAVAVSGNTVVAGAPQGTSDNVGNDLSGYAYVFTAPSI